MKEDVAARLQEIAQYYAFNRAVGHTWTMKHGVENSPECLVLTPTYAHGQSLRMENPRARIVSLNSMERLRGQTLPLVVDHTALQSLASDAAQEIRRLRARVRELERKP